MATPDVAAAHDLKREEVGTAARCAGPDLRREL